MLGHDLSAVANPDAMANAGCLPWYCEFAAQHLA